MKHEEEKIQIACVQWFKCQYPNILIHHSPNGGKRNAIEAARFKKMGVCAGFPDLMIIAENKPILFVEMKSKRGSLSANQVIVLSKLKLAGHNVDICKSLDDFMKVVNEYFRK